MVESRLVAVRDPCDLFAFIGKQPNLVQASAEAYTCRALSRLTMQAFSNVTMMPQAHGRSDVLASDESESALILCSVIFLS